METQISLEEERMMKLVNIIRFFDEKSPDERARTGDSQLFYNFLLADSFIEQVIKLNSIRNFAFAYQLYQTSLPPLVSLSEKYPIIKQVMMNYLPRLEEFVLHNNRLQTIYTAYENAFGENEQ